MITHMTIQSCEMFGVWLQNGWSSKSQVPSWVNSTQTNKQKQQLRDCLSVGWLSVGPLSSIAPLLSSLSAVVWWPHTSGHVDLGFKKRGGGGCCLHFPCLTCLQEGRADFCCLLLLSCCHTYIVLDNTCMPSTGQELLKRVWFPMRGLSSIIWSDIICQHISPGWEWHVANWVSRWFFLLFLSYGAMVSGEGGSIPRHSCSKYPYPETVHY